MIALGLVKNSLLIFFLALPPTQTYLSPAGQIFQLDSENKGLSVSESFIKFSDIEFSTIIYTDSNGYKKRTVSKGKWQQKGNTIFLKYDSNKIDTATISLMKFDESSILMIDIGMKSYSRAGGR